MRAGRPIRTLLFRSLAKAIRFHTVAVEQVIPLARPALRVFWLASTAAKDCRSSMEDDDVDPVVAASLLQQQGHADGVSMEFVGLFDVGRTDSSTRPPKYRDRIVEITAVGIRQSGENYNLIFIWWMFEVVAVHDLKK